MNDQDAARVMAALHGAYPNTGVDEAVVAMWSNTLATVDYQTAAAAVQRWVDVDAWWPTIASFNGLVSEVRREQREIAGPPELMRTSALRCDGSGWIDRGHGMEPCPACNPWLRDLWVNRNLDKRIKPPSNYVMPEPCQRHHDGDGPLVATKYRAMQLVLGGLREQLSEDGRTPVEIDEVVARRTPTVLAAVAGVPG